MKNTAESLFNLSEKVALVTGASRGIGRAIATSLAEAGADVAVLSRTSQIAETARMIAKKGRRTLPLMCDVSSAKDLEDAVGKTLHSLGKIDILVNNAGISPIYTRTENVEEEEWDHILSVNLKGVFLCSRIVGKQMIEQEFGSIINITSVGAHVALPRLAAYCSSKAGISQLTKVLAVEWAKHNIRVNAIAPGYVETDMTEGFRKNPGLYKELIDKTPLGRLAKPEEIAGAAVFLSSNAASFITGQTLFIDGGWSAL